MANNTVNSYNSPNIIVITDSDQNQITVTQPVTNTIEVNTPGPQGQKGDIGPQGPSGSLQANSSGSFQITGSLLITGSNPLTIVGPTVLSGSLTVTQGITGSLLGTSSFAINASTASFAPLYTLTSSFNSFTSSYVTDSGSFNTRITNNSSSISSLSSSFISFSGSYNTGSFTGSFTGSSVLYALEVTGSTNMTGSLNVVGPIISNGINVVDNAIAMAIALG
jgi:hypothetical protein